MVIGNGLIARAFGDFAAAPDVVVFASGVANSLETRAEAYARECELLETTRRRHADALLVYFSTCSVFDTDLAASPYVQHKKRVEATLSQWEAPYLTLRLPVVIGFTERARTLPYHFLAKILAREPVDVWSGAVRYPLGIADAAAICSALIRDPAGRNRSVNVALCCYPVSDILAVIESVLGVRAETRTIDRGHPYTFDLEEASHYADRLDINRDVGYLSRIANFYLGSYRRWQCHAAPRSWIDRDRAIVSDDCPGAASRPGASPTPPPDDGGTTTAGKRIVFGAPVIGEEEIAAVADCIRGRWIGPGPRVERFEQAFAEYKGAPYAAAVNSCSAALYLALAALGIKQGDEVIAPTMTFVATIQAIMQTGATPVLIDCQPDTFNIDVDAIEARLTAKTRALLVVHLGGRCCDMDRILDLARRHGLLVVEDCAHAVESSYHGQSAGLLGDVGCFSFYATKSITTGDGGMIITRHREVHETVKRISLHGMDLDAWQRARTMGRSYNITSPGFKYNMTDLDAAMGLVQLRDVRDRWAARKRLWEMYDSQLRGLPLVTPPPPEPDTIHAYHLYQLLLPPGSGETDRDRVRSDLQAARIGTGVHYRPVHVHPYFVATFGFRDDEFPVASDLGNRTLSLPLSSDLTPDDVRRVCRELARISSDLGAPSRPRGLAAVSEKERT